MPKTKKVLVTTSLLLLLASSPPEIQEQQWRHGTSKDEMTGEVQAYAMSPRVASNRQMAFPYAGVQGWLGIGFSGNSEWAYIGFTEAPNLVNTSPQSGGYSTFTARVRWDNDLQTMEMKQEWGSKFLRFNSSRIAIEKMATANTVLIELKWYGADSVYFQFSLNGSSRAIARARAAVGSERSLFFP